MKILSERVKIWNKLKKRGTALPQVFAIQVKLYLAHTDRQKDIFERFCIENNIRLVVK